MLASDLQLLGPLRALRAVNLYRLFGLAPSCRYTKQPSQARAVFRCARKAAWRSIYIMVANSPIQCRETAVIHGCHRLTVIITV